jgi:hypothetical protein
MNSIAALKKRIERLVKDIRQSPEGRPDFSLFTDEQLYQLRLEARSLTSRSGVTLEQLIDRFLRLDISALPTNGSVVENNCTYSMTCTNYRHTRMLVECGRAESQKDDMWRWINFIEERTNYA